MKNKIPCIRHITSADYDKQLLQQVAEIEKKVQLDYWDEGQILDLIQQDTTECWGVLNSDDDGQPLDKVVAYCIISTVFEVAEVLRIGTHPDFQRRGYAANLLLALIKAMPNKKLDRILLEVREDNYQALTLYKKMGFTTIHRRKGYYYIPATELEERRKCDALIMQYEHAVD